MENNGKCLEEVKSFIKFYKDSRKHLKDLVNTQLDSNRMREYIYQASLQLRILLLKTIRDLYKRLIIAVANKNAMVHKYNYEGVYNFVSEEMSSIVLESREMIYTLSNSIKELAEYSSKSQEYGMYISTNDPLFDKDKSSEDLIECLESVANSVDKMENRFNIYQNVHTK